MEKLIRTLAADTENVDYIDVNHTVSLGKPIVTGPVSYSAENVLEDDPLVAEQWGLDAIDGRAGLDVIDRRARNTRTTRCLQASV